MTVRTVARDDFRNVRRSRLVAGVVALLVAVVALLFAGDSTAHRHAYRAFWDASAIIAWFVPPLLAAVTYLAIAGDRDRGSIKYALGLPNSRAEYVLGKVVSRYAVVLGAVLASLTAGFAVAALRFEAGVSPGRFAVFTAVSALYALAMAGIFVAISAAVSTRSRAVAGVLGAYLLLVVVFSMPVPVLNIETALAALADTLGVTLSESGRALVASLSPTNAYLQTTELAYRGVLDEHELFRVFTDHPDALAYSPWWNAAVLSAWAAAPALGYLRFRTAELGA